MPYSEVKQLNIDLFSVYQANKSFSFSVYFRYPGNCKNEEF